MIAFPDIVTPVPGYARRFFGSLAFCLLIVTGIASAADDSAEISFGAPFELTDHNGHSVTDRDFRGRHLLIYFGYTHCPDVCPTTLARVGRVMNRPGGLAERIPPILISVDSLRDTPEKLAAYVKAFHPRMVGLGGDDAAIRKLADAYGVRYFAGYVERRYGVGHSDYLYLIGPDGKSIDWYHGDTSPGELEAAIRRRLTEDSG